jgi:hypothetical protein
VGTDELSALGVEVSKERADHEVAARRSHIAPGGCVRRLPSDVPGDVTVYRTPPIAPVKPTTIRLTTLPTDSNARKEIPLFEGVLKYFPAALAAAARVSKVGNDKHNPGQPMHHARGKSMDHADCILRHLVDLNEDHGAGRGYDENGMPQVGYIVWRALALAQEWLEKHEGAPLAPGAKLP